MALKKTETGQYRQRDLDELSRDEILGLLDAAEWCTREDLLSLFLAGEHEQRPRGVDSVVQPHDAEHLSEIPGIHLDLAGVQDEHADVEQYRRNQ